MSERAQLVYESIVLCDDIRLEADGRRTLVGVFTAQHIGLQTKPFTMVVCMYASGSVISEGLFRGGIKIVNDLGQALYEGSAENTVKLTPGKVSQAVRLEFPVPEPRLLHFILMDEGQEVARLSYDTKYNPAPRQL